RLDHRRRAAVRSRAGLAPVLRGVDQWWRHREPVGTARRRRRCGALAGRALVTALLSVRHGSRSDAGRPRTSVLFQAQRLVALWSRPLLLRAADRRSGHPAAAVTDYTPGPQSSAA